jgi:hypothetical protein
MICAPTNVQKYVCLGRVCADVWVCMCVRIVVAMRFLVKLLHAYTYIHTYIHTYTHSHVNCESRLHNKRTYKHMWTHAHAQFIDYWHMCLYMYDTVHVRTRMQTHAHTQNIQDSHMFLYMYDTVYVRTWTHAHTHGIRSRVHTHIISCMYTILIRYSNTYTAHTHMTETALKSARIMFADFLKFVERNMQSLMRCGETVLRSL